MPTERTQHAVFARDDGSFDQADLVIVGLKNGSTLTFASGPSAASAWAWVHAQILDRRAASPEVHRRISCEAVLEAARRIVSEHETVARQVVEARGWLLSGGVETSFHIDTLSGSDAFLILQFDSLPGANGIPRVVPPVLLELPTGLLPSEPCGTCPSCQQSRQPPTPTQTAEQPREATQPPQDLSRPPEPAPSPYAIVEAPTAAPASTSDGTTANRLGFAILS